MDHAVCRRNDDDAALDLTPQEQNVWQYRSNRLSQRNLLDPILRRLAQKIEPRNWRMDVRTLRAEFSPEWRTERVPPAIDMLQKRDFVGEDCAFGRQQRNSTLPGSRFPREDVCAPVVHDCSRMQQKSTLSREEHRQQNAYQRIKPILMPHTFEVSLRVIQSER